jgi:hypothetical protein
MMRYVSPPDFDTLPSLQDLEDSLEPGLRAVLAGVRDQIQAAYAQFDAATPATLHQLVSVGLSPQVKDALASIFKSRKGAFRKVFDRLTDHFEETGNATCPYCNFGEQWEHDHYLPKGVFPEFTLYAKNLVPICKTCNGKKLTQYEAAGARLFMYLFSELNGIVGILDGTVEYDPQIKVSFTLLNPGLPADQFEVLQRHFVRLGLARRYARQASTSLGLLIKKLRAPENLALGRSRLLRRLERMATDRALQCHENHWEVVLLQNLANSPDFTEHIFS